jgi:type IV secretion system protein VirB10
MATQENGFENDVKPLVGRAVNNRSMWIFGGLMVLAAIGLFSILEARRTSVVGPATEPSTETGSGLISSPPDLAMPGGYGGAADAFPPDVMTTAPSAPTLFPQTLPGVPSTPNYGRSGRIPSAPSVRISPYIDQGSPDPVLPRRAAAQPEDPAIADGPPVARSAGGAGTLTRIAHPSTTVPQGALIQAVLETALDSNRPGFVRAVVSRDVRSFDGTKILIPRGSRLFGEYKADLVDGQNRAFVLWQKLTRPDGSQMFLESPAADPLGRAGIRGKVNTHFFERFAGSILQSALDIGVGLASRSASDGTVVIGLPGSNQTLVNPSQATIKPTLKVRHGSSVSVFVARDLDFIGAE